MKPLLLSIQAFGPFAGNESVDFNALGSNPLFLINGATGAGKSTILDAICFALYGQTTGAERDASQMRCDFAEPALLTEISLEFGLGEKQYRVRRVPKQEKPKQNGEGMTSHGAESQLWEMDGSEEGNLLVSKSVTDATQAIEELIGLDVEQFRQVMVLPQGKFRELLLADSRDREKIFSQLFQTGIYKRIEDLLKREASGIKQAVENHQNQIRGILQVAEVNTEDEVSIELIALAPELTAALDTRTKAERDKNVSEILKEQAEQLIKRFDELRQKQAQLAIQIEEEPAIKSMQKNLDRAINARAIKPLYANAQAEATDLDKLKQDLTTSLDEVKQTEKQQNACGQEYEQAKQNAQEVTALTKQQSELEKQQHQCVELDQARSQFTAAEADLKAIGSLLKSEYKEQSRLNDESETGEKSIKLIQLELESLADRKIALSKLDAQLEQRQELEAARQQEVSRVKAEAMYFEDYKAAEGDFKRTEIAAKKTEMSWHTGQAALLAQALKEDQPCPVCGSEEHPLPAIGGSEPINEAAVTAARNAVEKARTEMERAKQVLDQSVSELGQTRQEIQRLNTQLGPSSDKTLAALREAHRDAADHLADLLANQDKLRKLQERVEAIKIEQGDLKSSLETLARQRSEHNDQVVRIRTVVDQLLLDIPEDLRKAGALEERLSEVQLRMSELEGALKQADQQQVAARTKFDKTSSYHSALETQLKEQTIRTSETSDVWIKAIQSSFFVTDEEFQAALLGEAAQNELKEGIDAYRSDIDALKGAIQQMQKDVEGKEPPELETIEIILSGKTELYKQTDGAWRVLDARNNELKEIQKKLDLAHKKNEALEAEYKIIGTLSDVANGQTGNKISLQRFVLSVLLDDVLIQASQRLTLMSKGRYQLVRKEDRAKGNKASGLELEVEDGYTGKTRSVATLSGGESFLAALSLALGLSDVVQSYAGGIKLDTLFIDEGFGSLDPESLDLAVRTLIDLQASGRTIGIISHVSELKEQMGLRIDVISDRGGSRIGLSGV